MKKDKIRLREREFWTRAHVLWAFGMQYTKQRELATKTGVKLKRREPATNGRTYETYAAADVEKLLRAYGYEEAKMHGKACLIKSAHCVEL